VSRRTTQLINQLDSSGHNPESQHPLPLQLPKPRNNKLKHVKYLQRELTTRKIRPISVISFHINEEPQTGITRWKET